MNTREELQLVIKEKFWTSEPNADAISRILTDCRKQIDTYSAEEKLILEWLLRLVDGKKVSVIDTALTKPMSSIRIINEGKDITLRFDFSDEEKMVIEYVTFCEELHFLVKYKHDESRLEEILVYQKVSDPVTEEALEVKWDPDEGLYTASIKLLKVDLSIATGEKFDYEWEGYMHMDAMCKPETLSMIEGLIRLRPEKKEQIMKFFLAMKKCYC